MSMTMIHRIISSTTVGTMSIIAVTTLNRVQRCDTTVSQHYGAIKARWSTITMLRGCRMMAPQRHAVRMVCHWSGKTFQRHNRTALKSCDVETF